MFINNIEEIFIKVYDREDSFLSKYNKESIINEIKCSDKGILFHTSKIDKEAYNKIKNTILELKNNGIKISDKLIGIDLPTNHAYFNTNDCKDLCELEEFINQENAELVIAAEDLFTIDEILKTNAKLSDEIDYINSLSVPKENRKLNQMEKFLMVYDYCSYFKYHENQENKSLSRNLTSVLNGEDIVCVGYSTLMKEMCDRLGIECFCASSDIYDKKDDKYLGGHANNVVVLNGKLYYADACWDSKKVDDKGLKLYNRCLIPIEDKNCFKKTKVKYTSSNFFKDLKVDILQAKKLMNQQKITDKYIDDYKNFTLNFFNITEGVDFDVDFKYDFTKLYKEQYEQREQLERKKKLEYIINYLGKYEYGEAICVEDFEKALKNIYLAKGMSEKSANNLLERTIEFNANRAQKIFDEKATNCFANYYENKKEL